jgi:glycosyltransferase involved in cell wall biosynthesis
MATLTVIIPALNAMPYLPKALASLKDQTFKDFEVLFWDNGSSDGTVEEALRWIPNLLPGRVVHTEPLPLHLCLARMVEQARTTYLVRMDADDICVPLRLANQMEVISSDERLAVVGSLFHEINAFDELLPDPTSFPVEYADLLGAFLTCNAILHPAVIFRRDVVVASGNYSPCPPPCEDFDLWLRVAKSHRLANIPSKLLYYRIHQRGIISSMREMGALEEPNLCCIQRHCFDLFGLSPKQYAILRRKAAPFSAFYLLPVAWKIACRADVSLFRILGSAAFLHSVRCLTARSDLSSRLIWRICEHFLSA